MMESYAGLSVRESYVSDRYLLRAGCDGKLGVLESWV